MRNIDLLAGAESGPQYLFEIRGERLTSLRSRVESGGGVLLLAIHPWYPERDPALDITEAQAAAISPQHKQHIEGVRSRRGAYLLALERTFLETHPPLGVVLEVPRACASTWARLPKGEKVVREWLLVPTLGASPTPWVNQHGEVESVPRLTRKQQLDAWTRFGARLRELGVRSIQICGAYFSLHWAVRQCVDGAAYCLQDFCGFRDVTLLAGPTLTVGEMTLFDELTSVFARSAQS